MIRSAAAALALSLLLVAPARADDALHGYWMDSHGEVILEIGSCGGTMCGKVAWLRLPLGPDGKLITDYRNPDPALRERPVCGLEVVSGFAKQPDGTWKDGTVYVSDYGTSFSGYAEQVSATEMKVTGYVLIPLLGQSEVWTKVPHEVIPCWEANGESLPLEEMKARAKGKPQGAKAPQEKTSTPVLKGPVMPSSSGAAGAER